MKTSGFGAVALAFFVLVTANAASGQPPGRRQPQGPIRPVTARIASHGGAVRVIVRLNAAFVPEGQLSPSAAIGQRQAFGRAEARVLGGRAAGYIRRSERFRTLPYAVMEIEEDAIGELLADPDVLDVQYDFIEQITLAQSTALIQSTTTTASGDAGAGWSVAILDTGVERSHPFFGNRVAYEACYSHTVWGQSQTLCPGGVNPLGADEQHGPFAAMPCSGVSGCDHGTHVAGIAAGSGASFNGVAPAANILAFQVFSRFDASQCDGAAPCVMSFSSDQIRALERVFALRSTYNIAAVNLSLAGGLFWSQADCDAANSAKKAAIDQLRSVGIATVIAAGNDGVTTYLSAPGCISTAVSVGATTNSPWPSMSDFSNSAPFLHLLAPGSSIQSSVTGGGYGIKSGTSMATPHVAGAWAVIKARTPSASVSSVLATLQSTGRGITDTRMGAVGRVKPLIQLAVATAASASCTYSINPTSVAIGAASASGTIFVSTQPGCSWSAASSSAFLSLENTTARSGSGTMPFTVAANTATSSRTASATIAGQRFTVLQDGVPPCTYTITSGPLDFDRAGGTSTITVTTQPACVWSANTTARWMTIVDGVGRSGSGSVTFSVAGSISTKGRSGIIAVGGQSLTIDQDGKLADPVAAARERARADFNNDGFSDLLWQDMTGGYLAAWALQGSHTTRTPLTSSHGLADTNWRVVGTADFNADAKPDIVFQHRTTGALYLWYMNGTTRIGHAGFTPGGIEDVRWKIVGLGDFNGDGKPDFVWQHDTGWLAIWFMNGTTLIGGVDVGPNRVLDTAWRIAGVGDLNADGHPDLIFRHSVRGELAAWLMNGTSRVEYKPLDPVSLSDMDWRIASIVDVDGDQAPDIVWHHDTQGWIAVWYMNGTALMDAQSFPVVVETNWKIVGPR